MDKLIYTKNDLRAKCFSKVPVCWKSVNYSKNDQYKK